MIAGKNDIKNLIILFKQSGYSFWAESLDTFLKMTDIQTFINDCRHKNINKRAPTKDPGWDGQPIIGHPATKPAHLADNSLPYY